MGIWMKLSAMPMAQKIASVTSWRTSQCARLAAERPVAVLDVPVVPVLLSVLLLMLNPFVSRPALPARPIWGHGSHKRDPCTAAAGPLSASKERDVLSVTFIRTIPSAPDSHRIGQPGSLVRGLGPCGPILAGEDFHLAP